jgi:hypothetical protein
MVNKRASRFISYLLLLLIFAFGRDDIPRVVASDTETSYRFFLPITINRFPLQTSFGIQIELNQAYRGYPYIQDLESSYIRYNALEWQLVEPNQGDRLWDKLATLEEDLLRASQAHIQPILIVRGAPEWARTIDGASCSRIRSDALDAFGDFLYDAVSRYSYPPYNVNYWEIWNEPDIGYTQDLANMPFGCWADYSDEVWGGEYYSQVLRIVYPRIKAANPNAQVVIGGLHLDCDPRQDSNYCAAVGHNEHQPLYLAGILRSGGGNYFDGIGFHSYDYFHYWEPKLGHYSNSNWGAGWDTSGPSLNAKVDYIRQVLDDFNISGKFLIDTEDALICGPIGAPPETEGCESANNSLYEQTKARYITQLYASTIAKNVRTTIWYNLFGFRGSALVDPQSYSLHPAYTAYRFARHILADVTFVQEVDMDYHLRIIEFQKGEERIWVLWSLDDESHSIDISEIPDYIYDYLGNVPPPAYPLSVTLDPLYLVWEP